MFSLSSSFNFSIGEFLDVSTYKLSRRLSFPIAISNKYENVASWYTNISSREAVQKGYDVPAIGASIPKV